MSLRVRAAAAIPRWVAVGATAEEAEVLAFSDPSAEATTEALAAHRTRVLEFARIERQNPGLVFAPTLRSEKRTLWTWR